jgi:hypothetical protein
MWRYCFDVDYNAILYVAAAIGVTPLAEGASEQSAPQATAVEAVATVFTTQPTDSRERSLVTQQPINSSVRPLQKGTFEPLRKYFSIRQQRNIDRFLRALSDLADVRNRRAELVGIREGWWWPTATI